MQPFNIRGLMDSAGQAGAPRSDNSGAAEAVDSVDLRVSKRLLWIGDAAYPLHNISRVFTVTIRPKYRESVLLFLKRTGIALLVFLFLEMLGQLGASGGGFFSFARFAAVAVVIYFAVELVAALQAKPHYVLTVETSGLSTAVVTSRNPEQLRQLANYVANAIENPETEFQVKVESIDRSPRNYYFGDNVNIYGGTGNVGVSGP